MGKTESCIYVNHNNETFERRKDFRFKSQLVENQLNKQLENQNNNIEQQQQSQQDQPQPKRNCYSNKKKLVIVSFASLLLSFFILLFLAIDYSQQLKRNINSSTSKKIYQKQTVKQSSPSEGCQLDGERNSFPDLDYVMFGYNILRGYPLAVGHDPGLTHPIFRHDYSKGQHTADCRYHVPAGYILAADVSCVTSFSSKVIKDSSQFVNSIAVSAQASGEGWGASFSASSEYKKKTSQMSSSESVFVYSQAKCNYYFAMMDEVNPPPFHKSFLQIIQNIKTEKDFHNFFDYYGTHFLDYALFLYHCYCIVVFVSFLLLLLNIY